jgi:hypothetical protein
VALAMAIAIAIKAKSAGDSRQGKDSGVMGGWGKFFNVHFSCWILGGWVGRGKYPPRSGRRGFATGWLWPAAMPSLLIRRGRPPASPSSATPSAERFRNSSQLRSVAADKEYPVNFQLYTPKLETRLSVSMLVTILVCRSSKLERIAGIF